LLDNDPELMFELLKVPQEKIGAHLIAGVKERVSSLREILGREVPYEEARESISRGFGEALGLEFTGTPGNSPEKAFLPSADEEKRALDLAKTRFADNAWIAARP
jgi:lipoate-protein ligase A